MRRPESCAGTNLALADDSIYVTTLDVPLTYTSLSLPTPVKASGRATGEIEALNLTTGNVRERHEGEIRSWWPTRCREPRTVRTQSGAPFGATGFFTCRGAELAIG